MKKLLIILFVSASALLSCTGGEDKVKISKDILPPDTIVGVLVDFHLAEAALQEKQLQGKDVKKLTGFYYSSLLAKHHLTREDFSRSMEFYSYHPKLLRETYDKVITELSTMQSRYGRKVLLERE